MPKVLLGDLDLERSVRGGGVAGSQCGRQLQG